MSAEAVVPETSIGVPLLPPRPRFMAALPSTERSRGTVLAASVDLSAAVTMAVGSVRAGPVGVLLQATIARHATRPRITGRRRIMRLLGWDAVAGGLGTKADDRLAVML